MKTLLKTVIGLCFYLTIINAKESLSLGSEVKEYDKIFERIAERRVGADVMMIDKLENPFISITADQQNSDGNETAQPIVYTLEATFDQKAKISGTWYKRNETIGSYKLAKITHNSVILQNEIEKKELVIRTKDESNVKIFSK
ncbi:hypothetical protein [Sulfurospirillum multivorans]|uniref:Uncharacterized protein n=2 Tax=Sulfurospirillum multivorans TaxID=66821 RepID=A0AA86DY40_SULMK|nr:hypothetical protein [Sulfurospirillum multivorans]AHJ12753.1 hypothetical protein SMUL_1493 [Sulfurospirillum multivorans DSM 12446]QEH06248.1 hypothetical protein SMN_1478 [Sulfurospirillum multivorans]